MIKSWTCYATWHTLYRASFTLLLRYTLRRAKHTTRNTLPRAKVVITYTLPRAELIMSNTLPRAELMS